ncbi:hypothetical protein [Enterococcus sp. CSURQ0835]|uniref:hypothetical protein n=1 Tax=Enterococcus sp. CSURQ0835 TaxID=2681394 RepID=UPI00135A9962|nr:hypothetical protein [Enterococcus sp. CSURQ0835]
MDAIEKIISQINADAKAEREALKATETTKLEADFKIRSERLEQEFQKKEQQQLKALEQKYKQQHNRQQVDTKQKTLKQKQQFLELLFVDAQKEMENWSATEQQIFAQKALQQLTVSGNLTFTSGEKSQTIFTQTWLAQTAQLVPFQLTLAPETIAGQAGFVLSAGGVQYNFLYQNLIQDLKTDAAFELAQRFFD